LLVSQVSDWLIALINKLPSTKGRELKSQQHSRGTTLLPAARRATQPGTVFLSLVGNKVHILSLSSSCFLTDDKKTIDLQTIHASIITGDETGLLICSIL